MTDPRSPARHPWMGVVLTYLVMTFVMTWPFVNWGAFGSAVYPGDARLMVWSIAWNSHAWLSGLPVFEANLFYPTPHALAYNDPLFSLSLLTLPIYAATGNAVLTHNVAFVMAFFGNGLAMHALAYRVTRDHVASLVAGATFAFSFYMMLHAAGHLSLIWTWLLPLSILLHDRWFEQPSVARALMWAAVLILQMLASWYLALIAVVTTAIVTIWRHVLQCPGQRGRRAGQLAVVAVIGIVIVAPLAAPYRQTIASPGLSELRGYSATWGSYLFPPAHTLAGSIWPRFLREVGLEWRWGETTLFLGWIATALAGVGALLMLVAGRWRPLGVFVALTVVGAMLSFGPAPPRSDWWRPFDLLSQLPGVSGFRVPARFGLLALLGVSLLAGIGSAQLIRYGGRWARVAVILAIPLMLSEWFVVGFPLGHPEPVRVPRIYSHPAIQSARGIASLPDYRLTDNWPAGADYVLYSTTHWRPIVNGYGRAEPDTHHRINSHLRAFPGPNNARTMRELGVDVIVVHAERYPDGATQLLADAMASHDYEFVAQDGSDYLFRVRPAESEPTP